MRQLQVLLGVSLSVVNNTLWGARELNYSRITNHAMPYWLRTGTTALSAAILQNKHAAVKLLLAHGAVLDHVNKDGRTPLQLAQVGSAWQLVLALCTFVATAAIDAV